MASRIKNSKVFFLLIFICIILSLSVRISLFDHKSADYIYSLSQWVNQIRPLSFNDFLLTKVSNYNIPYLYFLFLISKSKIADLFLIKTVSLVFDFVLAWSSMLLVGIFTPKTKTVPWVVFTTVLILPTVILNSSFWGQCDSIYSSLAVSGLYFLLKKRSKLSMFMLGLSLAFKLQAAFILPIVAVGMVTHRIKIKDLLFFFGGYFVLLIPPILAGREGVSTLSIYLSDQIMYIPSIFKYMTVDAPTFWAIFNFSFDKFYFLAIVTSVVSILVILGFTAKRNKYIGDRQIVELFLIFALIVPFLLPRMMERYFYIAEVVSVCYWAIDNKKWYYMLLMQISSISAYIQALLGIEIISLRYGALLIGFLIIVVLKELFLTSQVTFDQLKSG